MKNKMICEHKGCNSTDGKEYVRKEKTSWYGEPEFLCSNHTKGRKLVLLLHTKELPDKKFSCYVTLNGYDYSFVDITALLAQKQMTAFIQSKGKVMTECFFTPTVPYNKPVKLDQPPVTYAKNRIDNL